MKNTKQNIDDFLKNKDIAIVGASSKKRKFGNDIIKELVARDYNVFPVHRSAKTIENISCYASIDDLPNSVSAIHISTNKVHTNDILNKAKEKGINNIWVQQMSDNEDTPYLKEDSNLIIKECMMMFLEPVKGLHKFHKGVKNIFGKLPK